MIIRSENWRTFLNQRIADAQFQAILKQSEQQIRPRLGAAEGIAMLFALLILMTPLAVAGLGLFLLIWSNASVVGVIFGAALMVVGYFLFPTASRTEDPVLERNQAPALFDLVDGMVPDQNQVFVAPPNHDVIIERGKLRLLAPSTELAAPKPSVDRFFRSMAENVGSRAIGIVLSGTGSDGTYGIEAIRAAGGITVAQTRETAKYNGMPDSAIGSGCIDLVLAPEEFGPRLEQITTQPRSLNGIGETENANDSYSILMKALLHHGKVDFREYKPSTVRRRIERRMTALSIETIDEYAKFVETHAAEVAALFKDMMISVTSFFRDPDEFEALRAQLHERFEETPPAGLRVWVPGCATGEEAYSLAILLVEELGGLDALETSPIQIFATDIDNEALAVARRGFYPDAAIDNVPKDLRAKYFSQTGGGYTINSVIRDCIMFTAHNVCEDPPFSNIDLVTCRNLLIYFSPQLQVRVMARLHYAMATNGLLLLGKSESVNNSEELFRQMGSSARIFKRRVRIDRRSPILTNALYNKPPPKRDPIGTGGRQDLEMLRGMFDALVRAVGPDCFLVTADYQIKRVYGNVDRFITLSEGDIRGVNIGMIRDQYRHEVRTLITLALRNSEPRFGHERQTPGDRSARVQVAVYPLAGLDGGEDLAVVAFRQWQNEEADAVDMQAVENEPSAAQVVQLERELETTRESLQQTVEELETTNEELQALNEELQSGNEELQSTNEELETANEELQSTNEELITVNEELQINSQELSLINQELDSILANIAAPTLVMDAGLHIVRCSESARELFNVDPGVGRPHLSQCARPNGFPALATMISEVIRSGKRDEQSFATPDMYGRIIAAPYFSSKGELIGATAIVSETTGSTAWHDPEALLNSVPGMVWQKDAEDRLVMVNQAAADLMGVEPDDAKSAILSQVIPGFAGHEASDKTILDLMEPKLDLHEQVTLKSGDKTWLSVSRIPYRQPDGETGLYVIAQDISQDYNAQIDRRHQKEVLDVVLDAAPVAIELIDADGSIRLRNKTAQHMDDEQKPGDTWSVEARDALLVDPESGAPINVDDHPVSRALRGEIRDGEMVMRLGNDGTETMQWIHAGPIYDGNGNVTGAVGTAVQMPGHRILNGKTSEIVEDSTRPPLCVLNWNTITGDLTLSPALVEMLDRAGITGELTFSDFRGLIHGDDGERFDHAIEAHLNEREPFQCAFRLETPDETDLWLDGRGQAVWAPDGAPTHFVITLTDVTESWAERSEINRRTALADMAEETGSIASWRLNLNSMRVELSDSAAAALGLGGGDEDVALDLLLSALRKEDRTLVRHGIRNVADEAVPFSALVRRDDPDHDATHLLISGRAERDPGGSVVGVIGIVREAEAEPSTMAEIADRQAKVHPSAAE